MQEFFRPPANPINYNTHQYHKYGKLAQVPETPQSQRRDWAIRVMMEQALKCTDAVIAEVGKELAEREDTALNLWAIRLMRPFVMPSTKNHGSSNRELRDFAFDAYDHLDTFFGDEEWGGWFIAPYFAEGDDLQDSFYIGLFVEQNIIQTVVE